MYAMLCCSLNHYQGLEPCLLESIMHRTVAPQPAAVPRSDFADTIFVATLCAASMGAVWDLATGHAAVFDRLISNWLDENN